MKQDLSDFEYVKMYKQNKNQKKILDYFWRKYQPLVIGVVKHHFKFTKQDLNEWQDCIDDCFLYFPVVLKKLDLEKITSKERFSFGVALKLYLKAYTALEFKKTSKYYYQVGSIDITHETEGEGAIIGYVSQSLIAREDVEKDFLLKESMRNIKSVLKEFVMVCDPTEKQLLSICVDYNHCNEDKDRFHFIKQASFIKQGNRVCDTNKGKITPQYFYRKIAGLEKKFITHMRKYGYYSNESLSRVGLNNLVDGYGKIL
jgi:hypothetical protein